MISQFDISNLQSPTTMSVFGKRRSGVEVMMNEIFSKYNDSTDILAFSKKDTDMFGEDVFRDCLPDSVRHDAYDQQLLKRFIDTRVDTGSHGVLILDMPVENLNWKGTTSNKYINSLYNHPSTLCTTVLTHSQHFSIQALNEETQYIFIFALTDRDMIELYAKYADIFDTFDQFSIVMNQYADWSHGGCIVIDRTVESNALEDKVFWYAPSMK